MPPRGLFLFIVALLPITGCGSSPAAKAPSKPAEQQTLVTGPYLQRQLATTTERDPAEQVLEFWRDAQYANFPRAYRRLSKPLRRAVPYDDFVLAFNKALPVFQLLPRVQSVEVSGSDATVYLLIQAGKDPGPSDAPMAFNLSRSGSEWLISTDPHNVLGVPTN